MNIVITGGSGFLGRELTQTLLSNNAHKVTWVTRTHSTAHPEHINLLTYDEFMISNEDFDIIINLAGAGIADSRWSDKRKQTLYDSRLNPTQAVVNYIQQAVVKPNLFISSSAIGWYGTQAAGQAALSEDRSNQSDDFAHQLCDKWEQRALTAIDYNVPVAIVRTGVVINPHGGMISKLKLPFSLGLGGTLGSGKQTMSWIGLNDWVQAILFIVDKNTEKKAEHNKITQLPTKQIYNLTAPTAITNLQFTKTVGKWLKRPTVFSQPEFLVKLMFGEMATLLLDGQNVYPKNLLAMGFEFKEPTVKSILNG